MEFNLKNFLTKLLLFGEHYNGESFNGPTQRHEISIKSLKV